MGDIDLIRYIAKGVRISRVKHQEFGIAFLMAESLPKDFRTERRTAHTANHDMFELAQATSPIRKGNEIFFDADHHVRDGKPAKRVLNDLLMGRIVLPERGVLAPDASHHIALVGFFDGPGYRVTI